MNEENKATTTETTTQAMVVATKSVTPPPTKKELILATATALHEEHKVKRKASFDAASNAQQKCREKFEAIASKKLAECLRDAKSRKKDGLPTGFRVRIDNASWMKNVDVVFTIELPKTDPEIAAAIAAVEACPILPDKTVDDFVRELRAAQDTTIQRVKALLSDPKIKAKLAKVGGEILASAAAKAPASGPGSGAVIDAEVRS